MKKRYILIVPAFALLGLLSAGTVLAYDGGGLGKGRFNFNTDPAAAAKSWSEQIAQKANVLGISVAEMKNYWVAGKNIKDIAKEKGISETDLQAKMKIQREAEMKTWLQSLVSNGQLTQVEADARFKFMQDNHSKQTGQTGKARFGGKGNCMMMGDNSK
ncbi:MAG: hypothetical protein US58_C0025G0008 [Candidatus Magasanikbacteria bacterium GW2011_GWA2_37_8]|uniref:DUF2680 domain-containing protein n=1 Tax=Candidatus Magasanikbacteria bacterium GW2011_GWA2_37_8 TaxID=1619036 RepID=A0A0G0JSM4_9BACT|nr:MAG: hypothetical protein US58_C0025G0008 [Candidatus Magasanikbacteria bacterium GW2011_GWA2_37_8]